MARLTQISPESASGRARELLDAVKHKFGLVPNMTRAMANSPAALDGYLQPSGALGKGALPARVREQIALVVAQPYGCDYCLAAHSAVGRMVGLTAEEVRDARLGTAVDRKADTLVRFARRVLEVRGRVTDADLAAVWAAGWDDGTITEVVANVALHVFTDYFNIAAGTDLDFPAVAPLHAEPAVA
ncbi:carboxymuconolactone decarboxylase family protein [Tautonia plasticadhaerens]|uniref:Carboxymuconolactone decarboxylase family protein n=1 Tax=Tautonia plasticadhaerens TaxID=2527974 RepID=A0A518HF12_9BACT|nr:carboxymuconolactone decarboxylase family protein [Tautonia plasticadhaerens]QDV39421.1 Carboxymuconolactone decarboxylase family protein [Tautonia plasticadhaerens]